MLRRTFLLAAAASLAGCASSGRPATEVSQPMLVAPYRLDSGDRLRITVFEQASLTNSYTVDQAGHVSLPLIGSVPARGRTTQELAGAIAASLRRSYLRNPDVSVEVDTYRPFYIMGEVRNPGQYVFVPGLTVEAAIAVAGGFSPRASEEWISVTRQIDGKVITGVVPVSDPVRPGDILKIRRRLI